MTNKRNESYLKMELQMNTALNPDMTMTAERQLIDSRSVSPNNSLIEEPLQDKEV